MRSPTNCSQTSLEGDSKTGAKRTLIVANMSPPQSLGISTKRPRSVTFLGENIANNPITETLPLSHTSSVEANRILIDNKLFRQSCLFSYVPAGSKKASVRIQCKKSRSSSETLRFEIDINTITDFRYYDLEDSVAPNADACTVAIAIGDSLQFTDHHVNKKEWTRNPFSYLVMTAIHESRKIFVVVEIQKDKLKSFMTDIKCCKMARGSCLSSYIRSGAQKLTNEKAEFILPLLGNKKSSYNAPDRKKSSHRKVAFDNLCLVASKEMEIVQPESILPRGSESLSPSLGSSLDSLNGANDISFSVPLPRYGKNP
eukprot:944097_1